jgi:hypothetical protein
MSATQHNGNGDQQEAVTAYRDLRIGIGILGMTLPFALLFGHLLAGHGGVLGSVSGSYYTEMRNWFVGSMWATGFFLIFYRYRRVDNILSNIAGVLSILVALFPTTPPLHASTAAKVVGGLHLAFAASFLLLLGYFCYFLFTKSDHPPERRSKQKNVRNTIYRWCGVTIAVAVALAGISELPALRSFKSATHAVFVFESVATVAFGVAWLIKGGMFLRDEQPASKPAAALPSANPQVAEG